MKYVANVPRKADHSGEAKVELPSWPLGKTIRVFDLVYEPVHMAWMAHFWFHEDDIVKDSNDTQG